MMGQKAQSHASPVGDFLECGFHIAAFAEKLLGRLEQCFFFAFVHIHFVALVQGRAEVLSGPKTITAWERQSQ